MKKNYVAKLNGLKVGGIIKSDFKHVKRKIQLTFAVYWPTKPLNREATFLYW